ncbi:MAG: diguanylate cyclase [Spirochaetales bacterium]|nr:diguanylate cyclase [Spirochaetales bacterium]
MNDVINSDKPLKLTDNIWWVGHFIEGDSFQCHSYLIENGTESILFDPGSRLTFSRTFSKVEQIIPFSHIKYFVVHHQDPDITGALDIIDELNSREDALIISHWRAMALLKHLNLKMPMVCVESMDWTLKAGERELEFVFTPYLHFPGAFCTYDKTTGSLFSSDLMGGFTDGFSLFAKDETYLESIKMFHEHYMPSREILAFAVDKIQKLPLKFIFPQHGSIIREDLIPFILEQLKNMDCGLYLLTQTSTDIKKLSMLNRFMNDFMQTLVFHRYFDTTARELLNHISRIIPAESLKFIIHKEDDSWSLLQEQNRFEGVDHKPDETILKAFAGSSTSSEIVFDKDRVILPLKESDTQKVFAFALIRLSRAMEMDSELNSILQNIADPLCIALERELMQQQIDAEKQSFYELSIKDTLTGLYNRTYMNETLPRIFSHHDRGLLKGIALLMMDLDHFKSVNDTFGHNVGDVVLKKAAHTIVSHLREGDIAVRVGGEEFAVFLILDDSKSAEATAERIRAAVEAIDFSEHMGDKKQTISGGLALRQMNESVEDIFSRADACLYKAKKEGRNRITRCE